MCVHGQMTSSRRTHFVVCSMRGSLMSGWLAEGWCWVPPPHPPPPGPRQPVWGLQDFSRDFICSSHPRPCIPPSGTSPSLPPPALSLWQTSLPGLWMQQAGPSLPPATCSSPSRPCRPSSPGSPRDLRLLSPKPPAAPPENPASQAPGALPTPPRRAAPATVLTPGLQTSDPPWLPRH